LITKIPCRGEKINGSLRKLGDLTVLVEHTARRLLYRVVLNDLQKTRLSCGSIIRLLAQPLPPLSSESMQKRHDSEQQRPDTGQRLCRVTGEAVQLAVEAGQRLCGVEVRVNIVAEEAGQ
jgi:hypothetical protein